MTTSLISSSTVGIPELLAPAGDWEALRAAVANGADAVYFGLSAFNARHRAANFTVQELPEVMEYLHRHNVRGYVTLNVLIFSEELPEAIEMVSAIAAAGVDAVIVQDLGLARLIHQLCPTLPIHGSTQMTLTEPLGIDFVKTLGVSRVILARESTLEDIARIAPATAVPIEVFVHGALCVAYSGQCLTSESLGGRSANRGQCAQACRLPYDLIVDQQKRDLGDKAYLLSPQDLAAFDLIGDLTKLGVCSFKIEGRLKSAHYVAAATQTYRSAIDAAAEARAFVQTPRQAMDLAQSFSRGFTHGFLDGVNHQELVHARFPKSRGVQVGRVCEITGDGVVIKIAGRMKVDLKPGDGVVFDEGHPEQDEQGGRIFQIRPRGQDAIEISFGRGDVSLHAIAIGSMVWRTDAPEIRKRLEHSYSRDIVSKRVVLSVAVSAAENQMLRIVVRDDAGREAEVSWDKPLELARKFPITMEVFREQFGRMGDTPFELGEVFVNGISGGAFPAVMVPKSVLNDLRRQATAALQEKRSESSGHAIESPQVLDQMRADIPEGSNFVSPAAGDLPKLYVLARSMEQLDAVLSWVSPVEGMSPTMVYCEFEDIRLYPEAVAKARAAGLPIGLATIRVVKPHEHGLLKQVAAAEPDVILIRNLAALSYYSTHHPGIPLIGDYALNITNELTASILAEHGVRRMTPSYDLNWKQMTAMLRRFPVGAFEAVIHQHIPMFHMEHCVFAHTLSSGKDYRDCGRPCERHQVELKDRANVSHPLLADVGCRNTVYNGTAQSAAELIPYMKSLGLSHFRVELLRENAAQTHQLLDRYAMVLSGKEDGKSTWRQLRVLNQLGVTRGTLE